MEENKFLHHFCYVFFKDNLNNLKGGICKLCSRKKIPVLKCEDSKCKDKYHIQCAIDQKIIFCLPYMRTDDIKLDENNFNEKIPFYCDIHNDLLIKNFKEYSLTVQISKNDKIQPEITEEQKKENENQEINNKKNNEEEENKNNKEQKEEEEKNNDNTNDNKKEEENKEEKKPSEDKESNKKSIITSVINLNVANEVNSNSNININIVNNINKENEEKEKNNSNNNSNNNSKSENNNDSVQSSPNTPVKIDLSKHSSKNVSSVKMNSDINNISLKKEKSSMIEDDIDININVDKMNINNSNDEIEEDEEDMEYTPPEIKHENIDLFENFKNRNEKYVLPGAFYKFHY